MEASVGQPRYVLGTQLGCLFPENEEIAVAAQDGILKQPHSLTTWQGDVAIPEKLVQPFHFACSRKLAWIYTQGTCHLKGNFDKNSIELVLGTLQAACLMLFNDAQVSPVFNRCRLRPCP